MAFSDLSQLQLLSSMVWHGVGSKPGIDITNSGEDGLCHSCHGVFYVLLIGSDNGWEKDRN